MASALWQHAMHISEQQSKRHLFQKISLCRVDPYLVLKLDMNNVVNNFWPWKFKLEPLCGSVRRCTSKAQELQLLPGFIYHMIIKRLLCGYFYGSFCTLFCKYLLTCFILTLDQPLFGDLSVCWYWDINPQPATVSVRPRGSGGGRDRWTLAAAGLTNIYFVYSFWQ